MRPLALLLPLALAGCLSNAAPPSAAPAHDDTGQAAFAAIQDEVAALEADPATDWSRVNVTALRAHLVDMDALTLRADVTTRDVPGGIESTVTGRDGATVGAIQRMVPEHVAMGLRDEAAWHATWQPRGDGVVLTVTSGDAREATKLRALGFFGVMATGAHHAMHHDMLARGEAMS
jgi:hypothetical protein